MAAQSEMEQSERPARGRRVGCGASLAVLALLIVALAALWFSRERIADNVISDMLADAGVPATYEIEQIGPSRQILRNIVVGDPARPDLTVERAEVVIKARFGFPGIAEVRLTRPRLRASYHGGKLSFGVLDPLVFTGSKAPFEFPDFRLALEDGRGVLDSDYGPVGIKLAGSGHLRGGFAGELAAVAPRLALPGCAAERVTLYGTLAIADQRPGFDGPVRLGGLSCPDQSLALAGAAVQLKGRADKALAAFEGDVGLSAGAAALGDARLAALAGDGRFSWRDGGLTARYDLAATDLATEQAAVGRLKFDGSLRARRNFERVEIDTKVDGQGVRLGSALDAGLADAEKSADGTLLEPILHQVREQLAREGRASRLAADVTVRRTGQRTVVVVPDAALRGGSGETLLSLSRFQLAFGGDAAPVYSGGFATAGQRLPRIAGRIEQRPGGPLHASLSVAPYAAGSARVAIPRLALTERGDGALGFAGEAIASGALPGGHADELVLPLAGSYSSEGRLALWTDCTEVRFAKLQLANLALDSHRLTLCPPRGAAVVRYDAGNGLRIAAGAPSLQLTGHLGETPIALRSGAIGFAWPGTITARQLVVTLGPEGTATSFAIADLTAKAGADVAGRFAGTDVRLYAVPLDLLGASGNWRYADGRLTLTDGAFRLEDRQAARRFEPLAAEGASLTLVDNVITAAALLREPVSGRAVTRVDLVHNLATAGGHADLAVAGLTFDEGFQPTALTPLALGVVANVRGTVAGSGRIDWTESGVTSTGRFSSDSLDFAAAFGPVRGASGTIEFSDLLGMTTAPNQRLHVASINPGIEVTDGEIAIQLRGGEVLALEGGTWPFMGGRLTMHPVEIRFGAAEVRRYVLEVEGLDAARFVDYMDLENMSATGTFDGTVPLVFDTVGNGRVEGGLLLSRPPGGNVSYIGQLTYEDMGAIANFAFAALRSLDYTQMRVAMDGELTGQIVTRVQLDGVKQGAGAEQNILTRKLATLPIRVDVNIRAPFYTLIGSVRALYDPSAIRDPRELGLIDSEGHAIRGETKGPPPEPVDPDDLIPDESAIQRRESEETP
jgi:hypothetical protein